MIVVGYPPDRRKLGYYPLTEDDSIYIQIKKVRKVLRAPNWATTTRHDHRTLAEVMAMQDEEEDKGEKGYEDEEGYDYSRDSFPYAIHGVYYEMVEAGDHPVRPLARAAEPGKPVWSEKTGFWTRLRILLRKHYNKEATEKIVECFKQVCVYFQSLHIYAHTCLHARTHTHTHTLKQTHTWLPVILVPV